MITFEQAHGLKVGDSLYQEVGWQDGRATSFVEHIVTAVHKNSIDVFNPRTVWGGHLRLLRSDFPLRFWKIEGREN